MSTVFEASTAPLELGAGLQAATTTMSYSQTMTFVLYNEYILPADGFRFWIKSSLLNVTQQSLYNNTAYNKALYNDHNFVKLTPAEEAVYSFDVLGSLHYSQDIVQENTNTFARQKALFTSTQKINELGNIAPNQIYITSLPNGAQLAFNSQSQRYYQAGLWHYTGHALFSTEFTQIINDLNDLDNRQIVSNSLPLWLAMSTEQLPIYPSFLAPRNINPPFVSVDIRDTIGWGMSPLYTPTLSQSQLCSEDVYFTCWGLNNEAVLNFQTMILQNSLFGNYGISSQFVPVDDKHIQSEFQIIAQKKTLKLKTNYYQSLTRSIAQQVIKNASISLNPIT